MAYGRRYSRGGGRSYRKPFQATSGNARYTKGYSGTQKRYGKKFNQGYAATRVTASKQSKVRKKVTLGVVGDDVSERK